MRGNCSHTLSHVILSAYLACLQESHKNYNQSKSSLVCHTKFGTNTRPRNSWLEIPPCPPAMVPEYTACALLYDSFVAALSSACFCGAWLLYELWLLCCLTLMQLSVIQKVKKSARAKRLKAQAQRASSITAQSTKKQFQFAKMRMVCKRWHKHFER